MIINKYILDVYILIYIYIYIYIYLYLIYIYLLSLIYNSSILDIELSPYYRALGSTQPQSDLVTTNPPMARETWVQSQVESYQRL